MSLKTQAEEALSIMASDTRPHKGSYLRYRAEFMLVLLWDMHRGWTDSKIAYRAKGHDENGNWLSAPAGWPTTPARYSNSSSCTAQSASPREDPLALRGL